MPHHSLDSSHTYRRRQHIEKRCSMISTSLKNASAIYNGDLPATCDIQVLKLLARLNDSKDTVR